MLVLTRKHGESLKVGDDVTVVVLGITGNSVRVGIEAPKSVAVHREEVYQRLAQTSVQTAGTVQGTVESR